MSKEITPLEALEKLTNYKCSRMSEKIECKEIIKFALKRLEKIDEKPKVIMARNNGQTKAMIDYVCENWKEVKITNLEDEKQLKALEIIKNKNVEIRWVLGDKPFIDARYGLTCEEHNLLKEVFDGWY